MKYVATDWLLWHLDLTKSNFSRGSTPDPTGEAYDAAPDQLVSKEEDIIPLSLQILTPSCTRAYGHSTFQSMLPRQPWWATKQCDNYQAREHRAVVTTNQ